MRTGPSLLDSVGYQNRADAPHVFCHTVITRVTKTFTGSAAATTAKSHDICSGTKAADVSERTCPSVGFLFILQQDYSGILTKRFRGILEDNLKNVGIISRNWKQTGRCSPALWEHQDVLWGFIL